jgi:hypothetical protein
MAKMKQNTPKRPGASAQTREDRLKAALKANMARRKSQARARKETEPKKDGQDG